jgi:chemotaxis regulatin CheY-phosphate phosphatase CheZ
MAAREETVRRSELLEDSRSTLRQVEEILGELGIRALRPDSRPASTLAELLEVMVRAHREILEVVESLQRSRGVIQKASVKRLQNTNLKLREVSATTELAAADMLDGLDRALGLVDQLAEGGDASAGGEREAAADELRDELHGLIGLLQFQDITSQQLAYASGVLEDVEERLVRILEIFGGDRGEGESESEPDEILWEAPIDADPEATARNAPGRQALADEIFPGF